MTNHNTLGDSWTDELRAVCERKCGDFGDPPCWRLTRNTVDQPIIIDPCEECLSHD